MRTVQQRADRARELVSATRALFDERGRQTANVEEIAQAVGIARGLIYRQFASKDELYILTLTDYLREVRRLLTEADATDAPAPERLRDCVGSYARYCARYPAYVDASLSLMQGPAYDLRSRVSDAVWHRLITDMAACIGHPASILRAGRATGEFVLDDPDYTAHVIWTQTLGMMHLSRVGVGVIRGAEGIPQGFEIESERVVATAVEHALAAVSA